LAAWATLSRRVRLQEVENCPIRRYMRDRWPSAARYS
jgi:hypothetical protein